MKISCPGTILGLEEATFRRDLCERPLSSPHPWLCSAPPCPSLIGFLQVMSTFFFCWQCRPFLRSGSNLSPRWGAGKVRLRSMFPWRKLSLSQRQEQRDDHTDITIPETPLPITCTGRGASPVPTNHIRQQHQAQRRGGIKKTLFSCQQFSKLVSKRVTKQ